MNKNLGNLIDLNKDLNKIAIICEDLKITYRSLDILANSVSYSLLKKGIKKGDRVAIISLNSIDYIIMYLGILKLGAVAVLINIKSPQSQIDYILKDSDCKMVLKEIGDLEIPIGIEFVFDTPIEENDPAIVLYTSGSTSFPKGVVLSHKRKIAIKNKSTKGKEELTILLASSLYTNSALSTAELSISNHSTLILLPKFDAKTFIKKIEEYKINSFAVVPTMLSLILNEKDFLNKTNLDSVKYIFVSGSSFSQKLYDETKKIFKNAQIRNKYGLTEVGTGLFLDHPTFPTPPTSVGYPNPSIQYRIVNDILEIKSPSMMLKYINEDNKKITKDGFFITNDLFKTDEQGFYYHIGRADDMFTNGGNNIYPRQIETILETHPFIKEAIVIGLEDDIKGMKPYAFIKVSKDVTEEEIKKHILKQLPPSHCPKRIWILQQFPLNNTNKIDKIKLKEIAKNNI
jgi:acyl-CoA synthetase (AMP-forming)/AMP-acid ligase II